MMNDNTLARSRRALMAALGLAFSLPSVAQVPINLVIGGEPVVDLTTFAYSGLVMKAEPSKGYLLCANTPPISGSTALSSVRLDPVNGSVASGNKFEFGVGVNNLPIQLDDVKSFTYQLRGNSADVEVNKSAATGTLSCFGVNYQGVRVASYNAWYNGKLFVEGFDSPPVCNAQTVDSCVSIKVKSVQDLGTPPTNYVKYVYFIDYRIPVAGAAKNYVVRDGFLSSFFGSGLTSWCTTAGQSDEECAKSPSQLRSADKTVTATGRIRVERNTISGISKADLQAHNGPLVLAALFPEASAFALEQSLSNNVARGTAAISDSLPVFDEPRPTDFTAHKRETSPGMTTSASFSISDDVDVMGGTPLNASAKVQFGSLVPFDAAVNCVSVTTTPPRKSCSISFATPPAYRDFATYGRGGVYANITITATDSLNQQSTLVVPLTVLSEFNSKPLYSSPKTTPGAVPGAGVVEVATMPVCLMDDLFNVPGGSVACGGNSGAISVPGFVVAQPGPAAAQDELVRQSVFMDSYIGTSDTRIVCDNYSIFLSPNLRPRLVAGTAEGTFNLSYGLNASSQSPTSGVAFCDVKITDQMISGPFVSPLIAASTSFKVKIELRDNIP